MRSVDNYFLTKEEPVKGCLLFLRNHIVNFDKAITEELKYGMPFYLYNGKMCCYLWVHKKHGFPYLGIVEGNKVIHNRLLVEKRARMKILLINPEEDIDVEAINDVLNQMTALYKSNS
ncbi:DUF1801 domain-containing protein [Flavobacterium salilacus subsp. salilacus]|uniref:DUF1801 domain-containing protein n=1 Tax=Flavobacterium TaxID=237 RepID=UPI0010753D8B|nr:MULTISPECIES: DUF1801 domain-containing protein [Flavobacterium]KAF2517554.1 DUF1801 domain-containing protein [Flavobacterium salilacus subsp. salilacus]MBE1615703.1 DUF1801 domain-containing protein [Flavobacterium sp. SaA2.13]NDI99777.1 DUF1801 domain-containing protein [Flavobacterium salilacus subsp. altitudinum]